MLTFTSLTQDPNLPKKLLIGSLLALTGFGMIPILGWTLEIIRRNAQEQELIWPEWENLGALALQGIKALTLVTIWLLPVILPVLGLSIVGVFLPEYFAAEDDAVMAIILLNFCMVGWAFVYGLPVAFLSVPAFGILATNSFREALNPLNTWRVLKANPGGFLLAWTLATGTSLVLGTLGSFLCLIGTFPAFVITYGLMGQYYGMAYREALDRLT
mgnify:CR=1 FL=1